MKNLLTAFMLMLAGNSFAQTATDTLVVTTQPQMHCQNCEKKIKSNIRFVKGTKKIATSVDDQKVTIVYTAFGQYAIDGYRVNALDYLLKPISYVDFLQAANKALQWFELVQKPEEIDSIFVKSDYKLVQVDLKKIMYIEGLKDYIKIYTEDAPKPILSLMSMKAMEELLPSSRFIRVHRSFIVQKDKIRVIDRGRIVFDKTYIPISDSYKQVFQTFLDERS